MTGEARVSDRPLARRRPVPGLDLGLALVIFVVAAVARLVDVSGAGETAGEARLIAASQRCLADPLAAGACSDEAPPGGKWLYGAAGAVVGGDLEGGRQAAALLGALGCGLLLLLGRELFDRWVGVFAAALAALLPPLLAQSKLVGLEAPTGLLYLLTIWLFVLGLRRNEERGAHFLLAGLCAGLLLSLQLDQLGVLLVALLGLYVALHGGRLVTQRRVVLPLDLAALPWVALLVFALLWPALWGDPAGQLGALLSHAGEPLARELFLGRIVDRAPVSYLPVHLAASVPAGVLGASLAGLLVILAQRTFGGLAAVLLLCAPLLVAVGSEIPAGGARALHSSLYAVSLLAAVGVRGLGGLVAHLLRRAELWLPVTVISGAALSIYVLHAGLAVHPYYLDYYSELFGGPRGVAQRRLLPLGAAGEGLAEAARFVGRTAPAKAKVAVAADPEALVRLREGLERVPLGGDPDFVIHNAGRRAKLSLPGYRLAHVVEVDGAPLAWVYARRGDAKLSADGARGP